MNQVWLQGRLAADPEGGESGQGVSYASFPVAIERGTGEQKQVMFLDVVTFRQQADFTRQYFHKGDAINLTGSIHVKDWQDQSGIKHRKYEIVAQQVSFPVSGKGRSSSGQGRSNNAPRNGGSNPPAAAAPVGSNPADPYAEYDY